MDLYSFDADYLRRLREGDRWTEEHFLRYFSDLLLIKLRGKLRTMAAIDDVRQEVFVRVFRAMRSAEGIRQPERFGAFVNSVCNNVLMESYRAAARADPLGDEHAAVEDPASGADDALVTGETRAYVRYTLNQLPRKDAALLQALFLEERDKDEICRSLGVDRDYLRVLLHRAKERFRSQYRRVGDVVLMKAGQKSRPA
ncbi:MAG TPA: sigma-70 family RNA polymerase sigma factor [Thermoanaerobaculia bacterium]|nr:sigma-70 family RNA polymerase sigma factor [Thermoanaerobaculia bacterium]